jgi:hypothetical protein
MAVIAFASAYFTAEAGRPLIAHWGTTEIGYSADADLSPYVDGALAQWAAPSALRFTRGGSQIRVVIGDLVPPITHYNQAAQANVSFYGKDISYCEIRVEREGFFAMNEFGRQNVITHELGHCLGLDHSDIPGVMMNPRFYSFSDDDARTVASIYPPKAGQAAPSPTPAPPTPTAAVPAPSPAPAQQAAPATVVAQAAPPVVSRMVVRTEPAAAAETPEAAVAAEPTAAVPAPSVSAGGASGFASGASEDPSGIRPQPYAGELESGWSYVVWTGPAASPAGCGCKQITAFVHGKGLRWTKGGDSTANTLKLLIPGQTYWVLR